MNTLVNEEKKSVSGIILREISNSSFLLNLFLILFILIAYSFFSFSHELAVFCGILSIFICLFPIFQLISKMQFGLIFSCIVVFNLAPIWFLLLEGILPGYDAYEYSLPRFRMEAMLYSSCFACFVNFFYSILNPKFEVSSFKFFSSIKNLNVSGKLYFRITMFVYFIPLFVFAKYYGSLSELWSTLTLGRTDGGAGNGLLLKRGAQGGAEAFLLPMVWIWQLTPLFGTITFLSKPKINKSLGLLALILGLSVVFFAFLGGSRGTMMYVGTPVFFYAIYLNWNKGIKFWLGASIVFTLIIGIMELQVRYRSNLLEVIINPTLAAEKAGYAQATTFDVTETKRDNNLYLFSLIVATYPQKYNYEGFNDFFAILANPIPRAIWKTKPVIGGARSNDDQSSFVFDGSVEIGTTSLTYSIVGEAFIAYGIFGIIVYAFTISLFISYYDNIISFVSIEKPLTIGLLGIGVFLSFWGFRGFFALISFLYPLAIMLLFIKIIPKK